MKEIKNNAFLHLEKQLTDEERARAQKPRIQSIMDLNDSRW
jgi:hypothetical protein